ncbi:hypothetical protein ACXHMN_26145 [Rhizobium sp. LEGMi12c]
MDLSSPADIRPPQAEEMMAKQIHADLAEMFSIHPTRVLAMSPEHMLFDEAISALDLLPGGGMTMICLAPRTVFVRDVSDRIAYFDQGVMSEIGKPGHPETQKSLSSVH